MTQLPIAILGAGPVGLAAAAQATARGLGFIILEQGAQAGAAVADWGHVQVFSPWRFNMAGLRHSCWPRAMNRSGQWWLNWRAIMSRPDRCGWSCPKPGFVRPDLRSAIAPRRHLKSHPPVLARRQLDAGGL